MLSFSKTQIFSKKIKFKLSMQQLISSPVWHWLMFLAAVLTVVNPSFYSCSFLHSFLNKSRFYPIPSLFPLPFKTYFPQLKWSVISFMRVRWAHTCLGHDPWHHCFEDLQKPRTTMDLSCYKWQPELVSLGCRSFCRDESSASCSSDFEALPHYAPSYSDTRNKNK